MRVCRHVHRSVATVLLLAAAGACASSGPRSAAADSAPRATLHTRMPAQIGEFRLQERAAVTEQPGDSLFRYTDASRTRVTVFVYAPPAGVRVDADSQKWTAREGEKFRAVQEVRRSQGQIDRYVVAFSDTTRHTMGAREILEHGIAVPVRMRNGAIMVDLQYLYLIDGRFVKVRATVPQQGWERTQTPSFARELARRLASP